MGDRGEGKVGKEERRKDDLEGRMREGEMRRYDQKRIGRGEKMEGEQKGRGEEEKSIGRKGRERRWEE